MEELRRQCPSFVKLQELMDGDANKIIPSILEELHLPFDLKNPSANDSKNYINCDGTCDIKEFKEKYFKNAKALVDAKDDKNKKDNDNIVSLLDGYIIDLDKLSKAKNGSHNKVAKAFISLCVVLNKICVYHVSFNIACISARISYSKNMLKLITAI